MGYHIVNLMGRPHTLTMRQGPLSAVQALTRLSDAHTPERRLFPPALTINITRWPSAVRTLNGHK